MWHFGTAFCTEAQSGMYSYNSPGSTTCKGCCVMSEMYAQLI